METESVKLERKVCTVLQNVASRGAKARPTFDEVDGMGMSCAEFMSTLRQMVRDNSLVALGNEYGPVLGFSVFHRQLYCAP